MRSLVKMPKSMKTPSLANEEAYIAPPNFTGIFALDHPFRVNPSPFSGEGDRG